MVASVVPYPTAQSTRQNHRQRAGNGRLAAGQGRHSVNRCAWCGRQLKAGQRSQQRLTCSASCRSQLSRHKRRSCGRLLEAIFTMPGPIAAGLLDRFGLPEVEARLNALGWYWHAPDRAWERENAQPYREVA